MAKTDAPVVAPAKPKKPKMDGPSDHPPYIRMIQRAIEELKEPKGSSKPAILKYMAMHFNLGENIIKINQHLCAALNNGVAKKRIVQAAGTGANGRFLNPVKEPKKAAPKKKAVKKSQAPRMRCAPVKSAKKTRTGENKTPKKAAPVEKKAEEQAAPAPPAPTVVVKPVKQIAKKVLKKSDAVGAKKAVAKKATVAKKPGVAKKAAGVQKPAVKKTVKKAAGTKKVTGAKKAVAAPQPAAVVPEPVVAPVAAPVAKPIKRKQQKSTAVVAKKPRTAGPSKKSQK